VQGEVNNDKETVLGLRQEKGQADVLREGQEGLQKEEKRKTMKTYKIIRFYVNRPARVIKKGLTLKEAKKHCNDPKAAGETFFDGYVEE
jgi:hypothetical protein